MSPLDNQPTTKSLNELVDALDIRRHVLFTKGAWQSVSDNKIHNHFFVCAREDSDIAISLCFSVIEPIDKLHAPLEGQRCLTCSLYEGAGGGDKFAETQARRRKHVERALEIRADMEARKAARKGSK